MYMFEKPLVPGLMPQQQPLCQPVTDCSYWPVQVSFKKWNIITLSHKATTSEAFEDIFQVILDGISENMASLVQSGKYSAINTTGKSTMGYYVVKFVSEAYTLKMTLHVTDK